MDYRIFKTRNSDGSTAIFFIRRDISVADDKQHIKFLRLSDFTIAFTSNTARVVKSRDPELFANVLNIPIVDGHAFLAPLDETLSEQELLEITLQQDFKSKHWVDLSFNWYFLDHVPTQYVRLVQKRIDELIKSQKDVD